MLCFEIKVLNVEPAGRGGFKELGSMIKEKNGVFNLVRLKKKYCPALIF